MGKNGKKIIIFIVILVLLALVVVNFVPSLGRFSSKDTSRWVAIRYVFGKVAAMDQAQAEAILSQPVDITATQILFQGKTCQNLITQMETVKSTDYLVTTWQITPELLGIQDTNLQVVKTNCDIPGFQEYVQLGTGQLIVWLDGVFFLFDPR